MSNPKQTVEIVRIAQGGEGVGYLDDGRVVFVRRAIPGDIVEISLKIDKKRWAKGVISTLVTPSTLRIEPECEYFERCGGCDFWHIEYEEEFRLKSNNALDTLRRISKATLPEPRLIPAENIKGYRTRARLRVHNQKLGFFGPGSHEVVEIQHCKVMTAALNKRLTMGFEEGETAVIESDGLGGCAVSNGETDEVVKVQIPGLGAAEVPAGLFRQANGLMNDLLVKTAIDMLDLGKSGELLELFSGYGNFTFLAGSKFDRVTAFEMNSTAVQTGQLLSQRTRMHFKTMNLDAGCRAVAKAENVLLDPPRAGAKMIMKNIVDSTACKQVVYVSCDPGSLARDLGILTAGGWKIDELVLIDMFPRTAHIETIVRVTRD